VKSFGQRLPKRDAGSWKQEHAEHLPPGIRLHIERLLRVVETLTGEIGSCDEQLKKISRERYAQETERVQQVPGVGSVTALSYVLTLEDPHRFKHSRDVGCYLGCGRGVTRVARPIRRCGSAKKEMCIYASCWCNARSTY